MDRGVGHEKIERANTAVNYRIVQRHMIIVDSRMGKKHRDTL